MKIPYQNIDKEMILLIKAMNATGCLQTFGCCIGHGLNRACDVIFKVTNEAEWNLFMINILLINDKLHSANVELYQWHRLSCDKEYIIDWILKIEIHPTVADEHTLLAIKADAISKLVDIFQGQQSCTSAVLERNLVS